MIYARVAWSKQTSDILRNGRVGNAFIVRHLKSALHKFVATCIIRISTTESPYTGMYIPANVVTIRRNCVVLRSGLTTYKAITKLVIDLSQEYPTSSYETLINTISVRPLH